MKKLICTLIYISLTVPCLARIITVDDDGPADFYNIQAAINDANNGDTVIVEPGWYFGNGNHNLDFDGKAITVRSTDPNDQDIVEYTIIDCQNAARGFIFDSGEQPNSVVAGFTIQGGSADNGGAIYCNGSSPTISHCAIQLNQTSENGGGIYLNNSDTTISHCTIRHNSVETYSGGGIYCSGNSNPTISNCIIHHNWCKGENGPSLSSPYNGGGGICCASSDMHIINCTIVNNETEIGHGGGVLCRYDGEIKTDNSIIWDNNAPEGTEIGVAHSFIASSSNPTLTVSYSDVKGGQASAFNFMGTINWNLGNIDADPCFVDADSNDFHLQLDSPCVHTGDPNFVAEPNETDIDGEPRVMGSRVDMGVDEFFTEECYAGMPDYDQWAEVNKPECWCYPRQCHGDADGKKQGNAFTGYYYVGTDDLDIMSLGWLVKDPPKGSGILGLEFDGVPVACADFARDKQGNAYLGYWRIGSNDLDEMSLYWMVKEPPKGSGTPPDCLPGNREPLSEPGIEYEISPCDMGLSTEDQSNDTRFTVTVQGSYILFEDTMTANCCATQLWLEMETDNNQITIHEREEGGHCLCICAYPVTATMGPFAPGTYTIDVYEDWSGFIGSTTVDIE